MDYKERYLEKFKSIYPESFSFLNPKNIEYLVSETLISLNKSDFNKIKIFIANIFKASRNSNYLSAIELSNDKRNILHLGVSNRAVLMSYDFHITVEGPKLIEINTNAASYLISNLIYQSFSDEDFWPALKASFEKELLYAGINSKLTVVIIDENPRDQNMYFEFQMYKELLSTISKKVFIADYKEISTDSDNRSFLGKERIDFIYNRHTDFYFENSEILKKIYMNAGCVFSPHPREYLLLADKQRLIDISLKKISFADANADVVNSILLKTFQMNSMDREKLWLERKKYFFKPKNSFGSKSVYNGKSIGKKHFQRLFEENGLAQELAPPGVIQVEEKSMKYDLRAYVYEGEIQMLAGRIYSGQVTNAKDPLGGFCRIKVC